MTSSVGHGMPLLPVDPDEDPRPLTRQERNTYINVLTPQERKAFRRENRERKERRSKIEKHREGMSNRTTTEILSGISSYVDSIPDHTKTADRLFPTAGELKPHHQYRQRRVYEDGRAHGDEMDNTYANYAESLMYRDFPPKG